MVDLWAVQVAIVDALDGPSPPGTYPVFDNVPQEGEPGAPEKPYFKIGDDTQVPGRDLESASSDSTITLHGWSEGPGKEECYEMQEYARARLDHQDIGAGVWGIHEEFSTVRDESEPDAPLYHLIVRYRVQHD